MEYRHTQRGAVVFVAMGVVVVLALVRVLGNEALQPVEVAVAVLLLLTLSLFSTLTVTIRENKLVCSFGPGLIRKSVSLSDIGGSRAVRNPWYAGWGIRWMPGQCWLWNVSGLQAVELVLTDGKRFRIGTDEPGALLRAIEAGRKATSL